ncbi:MAG: cysteine-rich CWC family protein [Gammaproteobacteria bacterium]|nr:cysteine-rich CWC family protein [Gammaproteobacteria bacterium]MBU1645923.1 cysteine-rich CWC family protein [Gammaproteobacteria bacterium]MBU1971985.1 cysteine-rich CWC family protein [Gammaproteobacteria bacterium]
MSKDETSNGELPGRGACPRCGREFVCGMRAGETTCWCAELPVAVLPDSAGTGCYCPDCLKAIIAEGRRPA